MDFIIFYVPSPKIIETYSAARGGNVLGLTNRDKDLIGKPLSCRRSVYFHANVLAVVAFITPRWLDPAYDAVMYQASQNWAVQTKKVTESLGTADPYLYHNFAAKTQKPFCSYGQENVEFLRKVSVKYDPKGVFQTLVPGGFKVSQAC